MDSTERLRTKNGPKQKHKNNCLEFKKETSGQAGCELPSYLDRRSRMEGTKAMLLGMKLPAGQPPGGRHPHAHTGKQSFRNGARTPRVLITEFKSTLKALASIQK